MHPTSTHPSPHPQNRLIAAFAVGLLLLALILSFVPGLHLGGNARAASLAPASTPTSAACSVSYQLNLAQGGYAITLQVTNTSPTTITGWTLLFTFSGDQQITTGWNASYTQTGAQVAAANVSYDGSIAPDGSVYPGIYGTWTVWNNGPFIPTSFTLNGQSCRVVSA